MSKSLKDKMSEVAEESKTDKTKPSIKESNQPPKTDTTSAGTDKSISGSERSLEDKIVSYVLEEFESRNGLAGAIQLLSLDMKLELIEALQVLVKAVVEEHHRDNQDSE